MLPYHVSQLETGEVEVMLQVDEAHQIWRTVQWERTTLILNLCCLEIISKHAIGYESKSKQKTWNGAPKAVGCQH